MPQCDQLAGPKYSRKLCYVCVCVCGCVGVRVWGGVGVRGLCECGRRGGSPHTRLGDCMTIDRCCEATQLRLRESAAVDATAASCTYTADSVNDPPTSSGASFFSVQFQVASRCVLEYVIRFLHTRLFLSFCVVCYED